jgi:hypothetical protein
MEQSVYDPMGEFFPPYGATTYAPAQGRSRAVPGADPQLQYPTTEMFGTWNPHTDFIPRLPDADRPLPPRARVGVSPHRRPRRWAGPPFSSQAIGRLFEVLTALTVAIVCLLGYLFSYGPLQHLALPWVPRGLSQPWPLIVYGPWLAGCLSVIRAALDGRSAVHSWIVVCLFSGIATALCTADVSRTVAASVVAGLPPITAMVSLHQLARQLSCSRRSRRTLPRRASHKASR